MWTASLRRAAATAVRAGAIPTAGTARRTLTAQVAVRPTTARQAVPLLAVALAAGAAWWTAESARCSPAVPDQGAVAKAVSAADDLYSRGETAKLYALLVEEATKHPVADLLWRRARAAHDLALVTRHKDLRSRELTDQDKPEEKKKLVYAALEDAKAAVALDPHNFACHKWVGITLSDVGDFEGTKAKLANTYVIKEHFENAVRLNPKDGTSHYLLGYLCWVFADMSWAMHKIASALFATPPTCTYEKALQHFLEAENAEPGFYKANRLKIAQCYQRLSKTDEAKKWTSQALGMPVANADDKQAHAETVQLAKQLGMPVT